MSGGEPGEGEVGEEKVADNGTEQIEMLVLGSTDCRKDSEEPIMAGREGGGLGSWRGRG